MTVKVQVENLSVNYTNVAALKNISFSLEAGKIGCFLGPSGCGKTTALRAIAGFDSISDGRILIDGVAVSTRHHYLSPEKRNIGMVFQDFALFPHLNVVDNINFGIASWSPSQQKTRVQELLDMTGMTEYAKAYPHTLSGGQQQRIALARALAPRPALLLMDEPFSSMDVELRGHLAHDVRTICKQENITAILVTHDQHEAFALADDICVMNRGEIQQQDTGYNLYHQPINRFVADFIGRGVMIAGEVSGEDSVLTELGTISTGDKLEQVLGSTVDILIRPDDVIHDDDAVQTATVIDKSFRGADFLYELQTDQGTKLLCLAPSHHNHVIHEKIGIRLDVDHLVVFDREA